jgi:ABC-2 type transport system ATP-binding protein
MNPIENENTIVVRDLTKRFGSFTAVDRVSFDVRRGEIFGFLGPNGAGKSTVIRMLCGLLKPTSGTAHVGGCDVQEDPERIRLQMGYMSQKFSLYRDLAVEENTAFFGGVYGLEGEQLRERTERIIGMAGLRGFERELAGNLSGAFQQRLALGCAILHEPQVLFLDEPTSGVDPVSRRVFWDLIQNMASRGVTIMVTTHFLDEAEFCGRLGLITGGRLVALDTPEGLRREGVREDLFEASFDSIAQTRETVGRLPGVEACSYFGRRLHIFCRRGTYDAEGLKLALRGAGLTARDVRSVPPRLEDAFVRLAEYRA